jgi:hypothetical protein
MQINGYGPILHELGLISGRLQGIEHRQDRDSIKLDQLVLQVDRLKRTRPSPSPPGPAIWEREKFWLAVAALGATLAGSPELASLLLR